MKRWILLIIIMGYNILSAQSSKPVNNSGTGTVRDVDGNIYKTVKIGDQWWMAENLRTGHYRDGTEIKDFGDDAQWSRTTEGAMCYYDHDISHAGGYGALYNWYAIADPHGLAPESWHIATDEEWKKLERFLGMNPGEADTTGWRGAYEGRTLKSRSGWNQNPKSPGTDGVAFCAVPAGYRSSTSSHFYDLGSGAHFWTSTECSSINAWHRLFYYFHNGVYRGDLNKHSGFSVRCVKDSE